MNFELYKLVSFFFDIEKEKRMWPKLLDLTQDECRGVLRRLGKQPIEFIRMQTKQSTK